MEIDIATFEREIAAEYLERYGNEIEQGNYQLTKNVMNIAATAAAIAVKQYVEKCKQESEPLAEE